jgi:dTDP-glucose 4,6-dehydratase
VEDNVRAIMTVLEKGIFGSIYNIGADNHLSNLQVARKVLEWFGFHGRSDKIRCVDNRLGQDRRYSIDSSKIRALGWEPEHTKGLHDYRSKK